jgi:hypothetical protein
MMWTSSLYARPNFWCTNDNTLLEIATRQYAKYSERKQCFVEAKGAAIPKVLHFIWIGSPLPEKYIRMIDSWRLHHASWEINIWDDEKVSSFNLVNEQNFKHAPNFGMKSDILRYEILNTYGGVYVDIDYECIRSLDTIIASQCDFFVGFSHTVVLEVNNGLIGCAPRHDIMQLLIKDISSQKTVQSVLQNDFLADNIAMFMGGGMFQQPMRTTCAPVSLSSLSSSQSRDTISQTGPGLLTRVICQYLMSEDTQHEEQRDTSSVSAVSPSVSEAAAPPLTTPNAPMATPGSCKLTARQQEQQQQQQCNLVLFPVSTFHPVPNDVHVALEAGGETEQIQVLKERYVAEDTIAIHWWQCSWQ